MGKIKIIIFSIVGVLFVFLASMYFSGFYFDRRDFSQDQSTIFGASFRYDYAKYLGLDPKETALALFDLGIKDFRLMIPWKEIEPQMDKFEFEFYDWFFKEAEKRNAKLIINIGERIAGWPEYHIPAWALKLTENERRQKTLQMLTRVVNRYKSSQTVEMWQIENEPTFDWHQLRQVEEKIGVRPKFDMNFLKSEIETVRNLDSRPVIITDSGELSDWESSSELGDYFGTTLYRFVWQRVWRDFGFRLYYGYLPPFTWISPAYYHQKAAGIGLNLEKVFIAELQAEPWIRGEPLLWTSVKKQFAIFGVRQFQKNIDYARKTGFPRAYLWGAEWWYYLKIKGYPEIWNEAKKLWQ